MKLVTHDVLRAATSNTLPLIASNKNLIYIKKKDPSSLTHAAKHFTHHAENSRSSIEGKITIRHISALQPKETRLQVSRPVQTNEANSFPTQPEKTTLIKNPAVAQHDKPDLKASSPGIALTEDQNAIFNGENIYLDSNKAWSGLSESQKTAVMENFFGNHVDWVSQAIHENHPGFIRFRSEVLKEDASTPATVDSVQKFLVAINDLPSVQRREDEKDQKDKYTFFQQYDSLFETASIFNSEKSFLDDMAPSEYLMAVNSAPKEYLKTIPPFSPSYEALHQKHFANGCVTNIRASDYLKFVKNSGSIGRPGPDGGRWVQSAETIKETYEYNKEHPELSLAQCLEKTLGMKKGYYKKEVLISGLSFDKSIKIAQRYTPGTNGEFREGGRTLGTFRPEGIGPTTEKSKVAFGIWGLPENHPLHPYNAKLGNFKELDAFLSSEENLRQVNEWFNTPLKDLLTLSTFTNQN